MARQVSHADLLSRGTGAKGPPGSCREVRAGPAGGTVSVIAGSHNERGRMHMTERTFTRDQLAEHEAGADLTEAMADAPHGGESLEGFSVVGVLID